MFKLDIAKDQASYGQIYIGSGSNTEVNFISAGWMVDLHFTVFFFNPFDGVDIPKILQIFYR